MPKVFLSLSEVFIQKMLKKTNKQTNKKQTNKTKQNKKHRNVYI